MIVSLFDDEDAAWVRSLPTLRVIGNGPRGKKLYATCAVYINGKAQRVSLSRLIAGLEPGDTRETDHINGNSLDNRRVNLRIVSRQEQQQNLLPVRERNGKPPASRHRGVTWVASRQRWFAAAQVCGKRVFAGSFQDEDDAAVAAHEKREELVAQARANGLLEGPQPIPLLRENIMLHEFLASVPSGHWAARRTCCKNGHSFDAENTTLHPDGWRRCKECRRQSSRRYRQRKTELVTTAPVAESAVA